MRSPGFVEDPVSGLGERTWSPRGGSRPVPLPEPGREQERGRGLARSRTLARGAPEARPGQPPRGAPGRSEPLPARAPRLGRRRAGKGAGAAAGRQGRALLFPRAQLGRRFRAAAPESGPQPVGLAGPGRGRWPGAFLGGSQWTCAPRVEAGGRKKEITGGWGRWGELSCVRGRSDARAGSRVARVALWRNVSAAAPAPPPPR